MSHIRRLWTKFAILIYILAHSAPFASAEEVFHPTEGDWKVYEWKEYERNECALVSPRDQANTLALVFTSRGSKDYFVGVTDQKRDFPEDYFHSKASVSVDYGEAIPLPSRGFAAFYRFPTEKSYFGFQTRDGLVELIEQLRLGGTIFFTYDPRFQPTIVEIGSVADAIDAFEKCVRAHY